jgi:hypothetical protein
MHQAGFSAPGFTDYQNKQIRALNQVIKHLQTLLKGIKSGLCYVYSESQEFVFPLKMHK